MTATKKNTLLWSAAGFLLSLLVVLTVLGGLAGTVLVTDPEGIPEAADALLTTIRAGDWASLEALVSGDPALEPVPGDPDSAESRIWNAYRQSLQWSCEEGFDLQGSGVIQRVTVTCLDISAVTGKMAQILSRSPASDPQEQPQALLAAAEQVLSEELPTIQEEITLAFSRENGQWKAVPDNALLALLSGFTGP